MYITKTLQAIISAASTILNLSNCQTGHTL